MSQPVHPVPLLETESLNVQIVAPSPSLNNHPLLEVRPSTIEGAGNGLFARQFIPQGVLFECYGLKKDAFWIRVRRIPATQDHPEKMVRRTLGTGLEMYVVELKKLRVNAHGEEEKGLLIPGPFDCFGRYANDVFGSQIHNAEFVELDGPRAGVWMVSVMPIFPKHEIFISYGKPYWNFLGPSVFEHATFRYRCYVEQVMRAFGYNNLACTPKFPDASTLHLPAQDIKAKWRLKNPERLVALCPAEEGYGLYYMAAYTLDLNDALSISDGGILARLMNNDQATLGSTKRKDVLDVFAFDAHLTIHSFVNQVRKQPCGNQMFLVILKQPRPLSASGNKPPLWNFPIRRLLFTQKVKFDQETQVFSYQPESLVKEEKMDFGPWIPPRRDFFPDSPEKMDDVLVRGCVVNVDRDDVNHVVNHDGKLVTVKKEEVESVETSCMNTSVILKSSKSLKRKLNQEKDKSECKWRAQSLSKKQQHALEAFKHYLATQTTLVISSQRNYAGQLRSFMTQEKLSLDQLALKETAQEERKSLRNRRSKNLRACSLDKYQEYLSWKTTTEKQFGIS